MGTVQLNVRVPKHIQHQVRMRWFTDGTMPAETVVHALCETYGWTREQIEPIPGQLTVDETQEQPQPRLPVAEPASRRPRAADKAERSAGPMGTHAGVADPADRDRPVPETGAGDDSAGEAPAGCPECGGDIVQDGLLVRACVDCGWSPE